MDRNLRAFLAVARYGNLTVAADALGLTQPALTKTIRRLEGEFGCELFVRSTRGMALTEAGDLLLDRARAIETHWAQAREEAHARVGGALTEFRIAAGAAYHMSIAPMLVRQLAREFPSTRFFLDYEAADKVLPRLQSGELHLLLGAFIHDVPDGLTTVELLQVPNRALCCRHDPLARAELVATDVLRDRRWVIYKRDSYGLQQLTAYCLHFQLPPPPIAIEVDAIASTMLLVSGTPYLTIVPATLLPMAMEAGLVPVPLEVPIWSFPSGAWMRRSTSHYPILRRAVAILKALTQGSGYSAELSQVVD